MRALMMFVVTGLSLAACAPQSISELKRDFPLSSLTINEPLASVYARMSSNSRRCHTGFDLISADIYEVSGKASIEYSTRGIGSSTFYAKTDLKSISATQTEVLISAFHDYVRRDLMRWAKGGDGC